MRTRTWIGRLLGAAALAAVWAAVPITAVQQPATAPVAPHATTPAGEVRALWVLRTSLTTPASIERLVRSAQDHGFNTLLVQVRGRGDAYYRNALEPVPADLLRQPAAFDPLAAVITAARAADLRVHAWINVNLVSSAVALPPAREHLVHRHPDWLMVPRDIAQALAAMPVDSPAYLGKLARWTRQATDVEGLYASPVIPAAAAHTEAVVRDIARRYPLDGVHFDYARYPTERFDYSRAAIAQFRATIRPTIPAGRRQALDTEERIDLFAYPDAFPAEFRNFRVARMTALMTRLRAAVKAGLPDAVVSVAAAPDRPEALSRKLQDWGAWIGDGLVDAVAPMAYTQEPAVFARQIADALAAAGPGAVWAGIGAYRLSPQETIANIRTARQLGADGVILFSYDSLINPRQSVPGYLSTVGRAVFGDPRSTSDGSR
ncbi:MAG: family 10 glycosylhydrolase [Vicinamibacterales bacterium]